MWARLEWSLPIWRSATRDPETRLAFRRRQELKKRTALNWATGRQKNKFLLFLNEAAQTTSMISVTLSNRKLYVGFVKTLPSLDPDEVYFELYPI